MKYSIKSISTQFTPIHNFLYAAILFFIILYSASGLYIINQEYSKKSIPISVQEEIASELIRFHVIANSDIDEDQSVKMLVKEEVIQYLKPFMSSASSKNEAEQIILEHINRIITVAQDVLIREDFNYWVTAELKPDYFPIKTYGDITLPAGTYDALVLSLGNAKGKNWWCIMFPQLCFIEESYSIVPDTSKIELQYLLTDEEYQAILNTPPTIEYKSKIVEWFKKVF